MIHYGAWRHHSGWIFVTRITLWKFNIAMENDCCFINVVNRYIVELNGPSIP